MFADLNSESAKQQQLNHILLSVVFGILIYLLFPPFGFKSWLVSPYEANLGKGASGLVREVTILVSGMCLVCVTHIAPPNQQYKFIPRQP